MRTPQNAILLLGPTLLLALACVGTDLIQEPLIPGEPRIEVVTSALAAEVGGTIECTGTYYDEFGEIVPGTTLAWSSSDENVLTIDQSGIAAAVTAGQASISAGTDEVHSLPVLITVVESTTAIANIVVTPSSAVVPLRATQQFSARAFDVLGREVAGVTFTWTSSNEALAIISATGRAQTLQSGAVEITAQADGVASPPAMLTILGRSREGTFVNAPGSGYQVSGTAVLQEQQDGSLVLELGADFTSSAGPGLAVILSRTAGVDAGSLSLGALQSTSGAQTYAVPAGVEFDTYDWVVIHCVPFNVSFGYARF